MWKSFKFYIAILLMTIGCILPAIIIKFPAESISGPGALVVFFCGGGLLYAIFSFYEENYSDDNWEYYQEILMPILSIVFALCSLLLQIVIISKYNDYSSNGLLNFIIDYDGSLGEFYLRLLVVILSGLSLYPLYTMAIGEIDTTVYEWVKITTYKGVELEREYVSHSCDESKVAFFFTTMFIAGVGIMANSLPIILIILGLNISQLIKNKYKLIPQLTGIISAIIIAVISVINVYNIEEGFDPVINIAVELLPIFFALLVLLFFITYFKIEWMGHPVILIVALVLSIFISYLISLGCSELIIKLINVFKN